LFFFRCSLKLHLLLIFCDIVKRKRNISSIMNEKYLNIPTTKERESLTIRKMWPDCQMMLNKSYINSKLCSISLLLTLRCRIVLLVSI
jgi:hypothetical protein